MNTFLRQRNKKARYPHLVVLVAALFLAGGAAAQYTASDALSGGAHAVARPLFSLRDSAAAAAGHAMNFLKSKKHLAKENDALRNELNRLKLYTRATHLLEEENRTLKTLLGRTGDESQIIAAVLARPSASPYDTLLIDAGAAHGLLGGEYAAVSGDTVVGTVEKVLSKTALVKLFSTHGVETPVMIGPERVETVAVGHGGGTFSALLPRGVAVSEGDEVIMPGMSPSRFGVVEKVIADPAQPFHKILFKNPVNLFEIQYIVVFNKE